VICARDGTGLFTDPPFGVRAEDGTLYGYHQAMDLPYCGMFRVSNTPDAPVPLTNGVYRPNGLCPSPDERHIYISDNSGRQHKVAVCDVAGNLWVAGATGFMFTRTVARASLTPGAGNGDEP